MRLVALRHVLLIMLAGLAGPGCAKEELLMHKVDVHQVFADERVAELADAIAEDDARRVHALAKSVDLGFRGDKNVTLLQWAVLNQSLNAMKALLAAGADPALYGMDGYTVLHTAAMVNDPAYLQALLDAGVGPDLSDSEGQTPLGAAVKARRSKQMHALLAAGADPDRRDVVGDTALHVAGMINDAAAALSLLKVGASPDVTNAQGATFQRYLFKADERLLNQRGHQEREAVRTWLRERKIPMEPHQN